MCIVEIRYFIADKKLSIATKIKVYKTDGVVWGRNYMFAVPGGKNFEIFETRIVIHIYGIIKIYHGKYKEINKKRD